jgi:hypothetical protein
VELRGRESWPIILPKCSTSTEHLGFFYMPQIYDMGPTALLPFRRKASAGFEPANLGTKGQHVTPRSPKPLNYVTDHMSFLAVKQRQLQWAGYAARMEKGQTL